jgi:hypothetical protein
MIDEGQDVSDTAGDSQRVWWPISFLRFGDEKQTGTVKMGDRLFADLPVNASGRRSPSPILKTG